MSVDETCRRIQDELLARCDLAVARQIFGVARQIFGGTMHDLRKIGPEHDIGSGVDLQCLKCGSVFRSASLNMAFALIDCDEEQRIRKDVLIDSIPIMVSLDSEKYATSLAGY